MDVGTILSTAWPGLECVFLHARPSTEDLDYADPPQCPTILTTRTLHLHGEWDWRHLELTLRLLPRLEHLRVEVFDDQVTDLMPSIVHAMRRGLHCLLDVAVHIRCYDETSDEDEDMDLLPSIQELLRSIRKCPRLQSVELPGYTPSDVVFIRRALHPLGVVFESPPRDLI
jgi:hypothetical protein